MNPKTHYSLCVLPELRKRTLWLYRALEGVDIRRYPLCFHYSRRWKDCHFFEYSQHGSHYIDHLLAKLHTLERKFIRYQYFCQSLNATLYDTILYRPGNPGFQQTANHFHALCQKEKMNSIG